MYLLQLFMVRAIFVSRFFGPQDIFEFFISLQINKVWLIYFGYVTFSFPEMKWASLKIVVPHLAIYVFANFNECNSLNCRTSNLDLYPWLLCNDLMLIWSIFGRLSNKIAWIFKPKAFSTSMIIGIFNESIMLLLKIIVLKVMVF